MAGVQREVRAVNGLLSVPKSRHQCSPGWTVSDKPLVAWGVEVPGLHPMIEDRAITHAPKGSVFHCHCGKVLVAVDNPSWRDNGRALWRYPTVWKRESRWQRRRRLRHERVADYGACGL